MTARIRSLAPALVGVFALSLFFPSAALAGDTSSFGAALAKSPLHALGTAFLGGLLVSLTPCIYPMIAITVSVFGAAETKSRARSLGLSAAFVLGMAVLFTALGIAAVATGTIFGSLLSNKWVVSALAAIFLVLAASMFGAFEMALPSSLQNRLATMGGVGFGGAFTLGLVTAPIAAPCTGPVLTGILVWIAGTHSYVYGTAVMFVFALGLGVPFFLVGAFAMSLPKGGAWMLGIKWFFGVVLSLMALYYLRNAFPVLRLPVATTAYGIAGAAALGVGLVGATVHVLAERRKSTFSHLSRPFKLGSIPFALAGGFVLLSVVDRPAGAEAAAQRSTTTRQPNGEMRWFDSEADGLAVAAKEKRPVIVDFGAEWCVACKELTNKTFADAKVRAEGARFVAVRVDATDDENVQVTRIKDKYKVVGLPTVVVLDSGGKERLRFNEFVAAEEFLAAIRTVD